MAVQKIKTIGVFGCGLIGSSWAAYFAGKGLNVRMYDAFPGVAEKGRVKALELLRFLEKSKLLKKGEAGKAVKKISSFDHPAEWAKGVDAVQESVSENYDIKIKAYREMDALLSPDVLLMSSTSGLLISKIQEVMKHPERSLIAHPFNPPHLIPLVELVPGNRTLPENIQRAREFFESIKKIPVVLKKEVPGLLANRLAGALWREAIHLVASGVASLEDVDKAVYAGPGLRWAFMGQHLTYSLAAADANYRTFMDHIGRGFHAYWSDMPTWTNIPPDAEKAIIQGWEEMVRGKTPDELKAHRDKMLVRVVRAVYGNDLSDKKVKKEGRIRKKSRSSKK